MKYNIKNAQHDEHAWKCVKCNFYFTLYGPAKCYVRPNFCPCCGVPYREDEDESL